ncbi:MAG: hypothetical protein IPJ23_05925 [Ignavibacteriales bacterium]|nr:hypothetical protein [Ignavibacteriales bacterium]
MFETRSRNTLNDKGAIKITLLSLTALLLGHLMLTTIIPNVILNFIGLMILVAFIYLNTLKKKDIFSFIMVIYFCSTFPYLSSKGGGFNMVSLVCILLYLISYGRIPGEKRNSDKWFKYFVIILISSSILGWIFNYTGAD